MQRRGITLLEVMIYVVMAGMATMAVGALFSLGRSAQKTTISGYLVSGETDTALRWIRRDLQETALVAVRSFPYPGAPAQAPGCSLVSARDVSTSDPVMNNSQYGKPLWTKNVFYTLRPGSDGRRGDLVRWEQALPAAEKDFVPRASGIMPASIANPNAQRVLLRNVLLPNQAVPNLQGQPADFKSDQFGGFRVLFVRRKGGPAGAEEFTPVCPGDTTQPQMPDSATRLISVRLQVLSTDVHHPDFYQLEMRISPRF